MDNKKDLYVISGCDSGIGKSLASFLISKGIHVAVSYLEKAPFENIEGVHCFKMDLRIEGEIKSFTDEVKKLCQGGYMLRCLVSNAGVAMGGPIEDLPIQIMKEVFEVNFFGAVSFIQKLIPELIASKGRVVIVGSLAGRIALPFLSPYVATKFAIEGFNDSLRRELNPFGIKTILLEFGAVATPIWNKAKKQYMSFIEDKYLNSMNKFRDSFIDGGNSGLNPDVSAKLVYQAIAKKNPKKRVIISMHPFMDTAQLFIPAGVIDKLVVGFFDMTYGTAFIKR